MNGMDERNKTLGQLRADLQTRLGFVSQGPGSLNNKATMNSFLQEAHSLICDEVDVAAMRKRTIIRLAKGSSLYDYHNDEQDEWIDPGRVIGIWVKVGDTSRERLTQGIAETDRELQDFRSSPTKYDTIDSQLEVWPTPDQEYDLIVEYTAPPGRFEQDADRPSVPSDLVFLYALSIGKAHYRHPDAQLSGQIFERRLRVFKQRQHENKRYFMGTPAGCEPQVVRTADGYRLRG